MCAYAEQYGSSLRLKWFYQCNVDYPHRIIIPNDGSLVEKIFLRDTWMGSIMLTFCVMIVS